MYYEKQDQGLFKRKSPERNLNDNSAFGYVSAQLVDLIKIKKVRLG